MGWSGLSLGDLIDIGRAMEKADQNARRLDRLEDQLRGRDEHNRALVIGWWQAAIAGVFLLGSSFGSAALVLALG